MYKVVVADQVSGQPLVRRRPLTNLLCYLQKPPAMPCRRLSNLRYPPSAARAWRDRGSGAKMRFCIRQGRLLDGGLLGQFVRVHGERLADPQRIGKMIPARVRGVRMDQNAQSAVI